MVLKGISPLISPSLLKILAEMGHGDEIVLADAHFPSHSICEPHIPVVRADGISPFHPSLSLFLALTLTLRYHTHNSLRNLSIGSLSSHRALI